jgi:hypothetical protein
MTTNNNLRCTYFANQLKCKLPSDFSETNGDAIVEKLKQAIEVKAVFNDSVFHAELDADGQTFKLSIAIKARFNRLQGLFDTSIDNNNGSYSTN